MLICRCGTRAVLALLILTQLPNSRAQSGEFVSAPDPAQEAAVLARDSSGNGIYLQVPGIYDEMSLELMLQAARAQLAALQPISQTPLQAGYGAVSGGAYTQSGWGVQVNGGPPIPSSVVQTLTGPTSQTAATSGASPDTSTLTTTQPSTTTATTTSAPSSPSMTAPAFSGFATPTTMGTNALELLNEEMQLTYEIANLQLLLEGPLSDRYVLNEPLTKTKTTIGFSISIDASRYKDSVAVVEVQVASPTANTFTGEEPVSVTALLPREKTYNVAAITTKQAGIGAGIATAVIQGGFSWFHGRSTYYVVQDQDTVSLQVPSTSRMPRTTAFEWQFRPVLGQKFVQAGMRQTFVQLAAPVTAMAGCFGVLHVRTYWRHYDAKTGQVGHLIPGSLEAFTSHPIPIYNLTPYIRGLDFDDLGNGNVEVKVRGTFINGTYVRVGSTFYQPGVPGFTLEPTLLRFTAPASSLLVDQPELVARDGTETPIINPADPDPNAFPRRDQSCDADQMSLKPPPQSKSLTLPQDCGGVPEVLATHTSVLDQSNSLLTVFVKALPLEPGLDKYLVRIGTHVFGLADAPLRRIPPPATPDRCITVFQAAVPTDVLTSATRLAVQPLLWKGNHTVTGGYFEEPYGSVGDRVVFVGNDKSVATFILFGNRLQAAEIIVPSHVTLRHFGFTDSNDPHADYSMASFTLPVAEWKNYKAILIQKTPGEKAEEISLPAPDATATDSGARHAVSPKFNPVVGSDEIDLTGGDIGTVTSVSYNGKALSSSLSTDKKTLIVTGLSSAGITLTATPKDISLQFKDGTKDTITLNVINYKVEAVAAPTAPKKASQK